MATAGVRGTDFDRGRIWTAFAAVALLVALGGLALGAAGLLSGLSVAVAPDAVPAGRPYRVVVGDDGADVTLVDCPPLSSWLRGDRDAFCRDAVDAALMVEGLAMALAAAGSGLFVASRRRRVLLRRESAQLRATAELVSYRQDSMPWTWWLALAFVGVVGALVVAVGLVGTARGAAGAGPRGPIVWSGLVYVTAWVYGRRRAYELVIMDDRLDWRAPLRRRAFPLASLASAEVRRLPGLLGEREALLVTTSGERLAVVVPNARHERRFVAFCDAVARRVPAFTVTAAGHVGLPRGEEAE